MRKTREILLGIIILGLVLNLLGNVVWHYLPDSQVYPHTYLVATIVLIIVCILHLLFAQNGFTKGSLTSIWQAFFPFPRKTLRFVPDMRYGCEGEWGNGEVRGEPAMCVHGRWYVTNMIDRDVRILRAYLIKPRTEGMVSTRHPNRNIFGSNPILAGSTAEVLLDFWVQPPFRRDGESFAGTIVCCDQFNNKHKVKARFEAHKREVEQILSIKWRPKWQDELNNNLMPKKLRRILERKRQFLSQNSDISVSLKNSEWMIDDTQNANTAYTAKVMRNRINLYKRLISNRELKGKAKVKSNRLEEELIVSIESDSKCSHEPNRNLLSQELSDVLEQIGELLSHISAISLKGPEWIIGNSQQPRMVYTAEVMRKKVSVYKRFISDEEHKGKAKVEPNCVEEQPTVSMQLNSKCPDGLNRNLLPQELKNELERMGELLSHSSTTSICMTSAEWVIRDSRKQHMVYSARLNEKKLTFYKRFNPPPRQAPATPVLQEV